MKALSRNRLKEMIDHIEYVIFPEYAEDPDTDFSIDFISHILRDQISLLPEVKDVDCTVKEFVNYLPEIKRLLNTDVDAVMHNDPAVKSRLEVVLCYPVVMAMIHYRTAHRLHELGIPVIPRILTEMAHMLTGVDIHPAAKIGEYFCFDHGTGIVIGATSIIGNHVMLYQGVTLGAKNFQYTPDGQPIDLPRHPIIEDNVTIYSNASVLGRIRIGHNSVVGGNVWLTHDVPPYSRILQGRIVEEPLFNDGAGI